MKSTQIAQQSVHPTAGTPKGGAVAIQWAENFLNQFREEQWNYPNLFQEKMVQVRLKK